MNEHLVQKRGEALIPQEKAVDAKEEYKNPLLLEPSPVFGSIDADDEVYLFH